MMKVSPVPKPAKTIGVRHKQACIMFLGLCVAYMQRVNVSVGIVAMTDPTASSNPDVPTVNYTSTEIGMVSSMFFYGYVVSGIPAGVLADMYGPVKLVSMIGGILCGLLTMAIPFAATHIGLWSFCALRILQGLGQGFFYPSINTHISKWAIPQEKAQFTWLWTGAQLGTIVMMVTGGELAGGTSGWPAIFYYSGLFSVIWGVFCLIYGADSPSKHKSITEIEKLYIETNLPCPENGGEKIEVPWSSLITSVPFITLCFNYMCHNWGFFTLLTLMPTYIHGVYDFNMKDNGFLSALPYLGMLLGGFFLSAVCEKMTGRFSVNAIRNLFNSIGFYGAAAPLFILAFSHLNAVGAITLLTTATTLNSGVIHGIMSNHLDLAPNLAGILMGTTNGLSNIASILAPQWAEFIVTDESNEGQWQTVFLMSASIYALGNTTFLIFGSTAVQTWNDPRHGTDKSNLDSTLEVATSGTENYEDTEKRETNLTFST